MIKKLLRSNPILSIITVIVMIYTAVSVYNKVVAYKEYEKKHAVSPNSYYSPSTTRLTDNDAIYASQKFVESRLKSPKSAEFPPYFESKVDVQDDIYTVTSYVDATNSFNATIRSNYVVKLKRNSDGGVSLIDIQID